MVDDYGEVQQKASGMCHDLTFFLAVEDFEYMVESSWGITVLFSLEEQQRFVWGTRGRPLRKWEDGCFDTAATSSINHDYVPTGRLGSRTHPYAHLPWSESTVADYP